MLPKIQQIKKCKCGSSNIEPHHFVNSEPKDFRLWFECLDCQKLSTNSYQTLLEAIKMWNLENYDEIK